jgi:hypothetical protein
MSASVLADLSHGLLGSYAPPPVSASPSANAAPDLATVLDIHSQVEPAIQSALAAIVPSFIARSGLTLTGNRIDIEFALGAWAGRWGIRSNGRFCESCWAYTLKLSLNTIPPTPESPHDPAPGFARLITPTVIACAQNPAFLPYHTLASCHPGNWTETIRTDEDLYLSVLVFSGLVTVRSDAWPAE